MLFNASTPLPGGHGDQETSCSPWTSDTLFPDYAFPNNGFASSEHLLPVVPAARATTRWEQKASHTVDPQLLVDVFVKKRQETFGADGFEQADVSAFSDTTATVSLTGQSVDQDSTTRSSPQNPAGTNSDTPSPSTVSSGTVASCSPAAIDNDKQAHVVQYNPTEWQKKSEAQRKRPTKPWSKEGRQRALSSRLDALKTDKAPKKSVKKDVHGKIAGIETVFGLNQVVRAPISGESQLATSITRRLGACSRCRQQRTRCDRLECVYQPCSRCVRLAATLQQQPCIRVSILDLRLHRKGPTLTDDLQIWVRGKQQLLANDAQHGGASHVIFLTQGFGEGLENALALTVSRFEPGPGDRTTYHWVDPSGQHRTMEMPPYFISDLEAARQSVREFVHNVRSVYIDALLADSNPIVYRTFQAALTYRAFNQSKLVSVALDVWVAARLIESHWRIFCGGAMIGLGPVDDPEYPWHGFTPLTPIMDSQLDDLCIRDLIAPLTQEFLKRLKDKIDERKKENWLEIYFAIFIMMSNMGWTVKDMVAHATWKGLKPGSRGGTLTKGFIHACKTMLSYFHFACNGSAPVSICFSQLSASNSDDKGVTPDQIEYLSTIQQDIIRQESKLSKWKEMSIYDDVEIYWCFQMLCEGWRGDIPYLGEVDDFTEQDFLSSSGT